MATALVALALSASVLAVPFPPYNLTSPSLLDSNSSSCDPNSYRTKWGIVYSCLSTISACVWVSIHPNIPGHNTSQWLYRPGVAVYMLVFPELLVVTALVQLVAAWRISHDVKGVEGMMS
jgi:hypothetical protein